MQMKISEYKNLTKKRGLGEEDKLHKQFAQELRCIERFKPLNCIRWTYLPFGEKRSYLTASLLKSKGMKRGYPDFWFVIENMGFAKNIFIEFKTESKTSKQSPEQKEFEKSCSLANEVYYIARSVEYALEILKAYHII